jgi:hypothetical protein
LRTDIRVVFLIFQGHFSSISAIKKVQYTDKKNSFGYLKFVCTFPFFFKLAKIHGCENRMTYFSVYSKIYLLNKNVGCLSPSL